MCYNDQEETVKMTHLTVLLDGLPIQSFIMGNACVTVLILFKHIGFVEIRTRFVNCRRLERRVRRVVRVSEVVISERCNGCSQKRQQAIVVSASVPPSRWEWHYELLRRVGAPCRPEIRSAASGSVLWSRQRSGLSSRINVEFTHRLGDDSGEGKPCWSVILLLSK